MEDRKRPITAKMTIALDLEDALQKGAYEKLYIETVINTEHKANIF